MEEEMISFFPDGLRLMIVDDDMKKAIRITTATLSELHYPVVAMHSTASAGLRALSGDNVVDVQAILCDVHKVVSSGFDFRRVVETELNIPVIYLLSTTGHMVSSEDAEFLNHLLLTATYIVRKPIDRAVMAQLWRVVAWRRCCLEERIPADAMDIAAHAGAGGEDDDDDVVIVEEPQVHFKAVRSGGSRKRQLTINDDDGSGSGSSGGGADSSEPQKRRVIWTPRLKQKFERAVQHVGIDANPTKIQEHMNVEGLVRQHIASHLQKYRAKYQKDLADEPRLLQPDSLFLKAILPTLNVSPGNPLVLAGGAGPSSDATAAFAGGCTVLAPFQVPLFQQQQQPAGNAVISFNNAATPVAVQAPVVGQSAAGNVVISFNNDTASAAVQAPAMGQHLSGGVQLDAPQQKLYLGPFPYQGPPPPAMRNHIDMLPAFPPRVGTVMNKGKAPVIELPFGQPVDDFLVGETAYGGAGPTMEATDAVAAYSYIGALQNNAAAGTLMAPPMEPAFSITEPTVATQGEGSGAVVVASEENAAPNNAEPFMVPDQVAADAPVDTEEDIMFSLESLLGLDDDMMLPMEEAGAADAAAGDVAGGPLNGMEFGWDLDLEDILMENVNDCGRVPGQPGRERVVSSHCRLRN